MTVPSAPGPPSPSDDAEFVALYSDYRARLVRVVQNRCEDPEVAVDEALLQLYRKWTTITGDKLAWATATAKNKAADQYRKTDTRNTAETAWARTGRTSTPWCDDEAIALHAFREALQCLSDRHRAVFLRYHFRQLSIADIAAEQNISIASVRQELSRAKSAVIENLHRFLAPRTASDPQSAPASERDQT